jgi:hypothetical protein
MWLRPLHQRSIGHCLAAMVMLSACATPRQPDISAETRSSISSVNVVVGDFAPSNAVAKDANPPGKTLQGGLIGAAPGAIGMASIAPLCSNPYTIGVCAVFMPVYALLTVAGGALGASHEQSAGEMQANAQRALNEAFKVEHLQQGLLTHLLVYAGETSSRTFRQIQPATANATSADDQLEIGVVNVDGIEVQGGTWGFLSTHYALILEARARLKRHSDSTALLDRTYRYLSAPRTAEEWSNKSGKQLFAEMELGYAHLAEWIIDDFFRGRRAEGNIAIPKPVEPAVRFSLFGPLTESALLYPTPVGSLTPTLRWSYDSAYFKSKTQPGGLRYEVQISSADKVGRYLWAMSPIYRRKNLPGMSHVVEEMLEPCAIYIWTVRAEAEKDGETQVSEWSGRFLEGLSDRVRLASPKIDHQDFFKVNQPIILRQRIANYGYPFKTPCNGEAPDKGVLETISATTMGSAPPPASARTALTASAPKPAAQPLEGVFQSKQLKTSGLTGLAKGIEITFSISNLSGQPITSFAGKIRFLDDTGAEIGSLGINARTPIPAGGRVAMTRTMFPVIFPGYSRLRDVPQETIRAEFTFDTVEFGK